MNSMASEKKMTPGDLGIDLSSGAPDQLYRWLLASLLFGKRIQQDIAARTWHVLINNGLTSPEKLAAVSREELGNPVYPPARRELHSHGVPCDGHHARQITQADVDEYDHIYYMDSSNLRYLQRMFPGETKFQSFLDRNVADPWYSGNFTQTWADVVEGCTRIMEELA